MTDSSPPQAEPSATTARSNAASRGRRKGWVWLGAGLAASVVAVAAVGIDLALTWRAHAPVIAALRTSPPERTGYMERRAREGRSPGARTWVTLDSLPPTVVCAVVASENVNFFRTGPLDWANQRQLLGRMLHGDFSRGGSGITQQLARNLFLAPDRTPRRKLREYVLAFAISRNLSKERQLELYLNLIEWGEGAWGVAAGSERLFGRPPDSLTPTQAILLANVLPAPSRGLAYPLSPPRRGKLERIAGVLWRQGVFDELTWSATMARLRLLGQAIDAGETPLEAASAAARVMGPEPAQPLAGDAEPWPTRCDPKRRGVG
ncbi:MAG: biosynthetic peptidoglycan transglycosylase [Gemmatimonadales bacterium]